MKTFLLVMLLIVAVLGVATFVNDNGLRGGILVGMEDVIAVAVPQRRAAQITTDVSRCGLDCRGNDVAMCGGHFRPGRGYSCGRMGFA